MTGVSGAARLVGFTIHGPVAGDVAGRIESAHERALCHFPWLDRRTERVGPLTIHFWGSAPERKLDRTGGRICLSCGRGREGRFVEVLIERAGESLVVSTDWLGGVPVYRLARDPLVLTTLEPVAAAAAPVKLFLPGLAAMLMNGHFEGEWTLTEGVRICPPDADVEWGGSWRAPRPRRTVVPAAEETRAPGAALDELHERTRAVVAASLESAPTWALPLSAGLDSRLFAAVATELGAEVRTFTYGWRGGSEVILGEQVARALELDWTFVDVGTRYLEDHTPFWADWFGAAMHFHGMYQVPFLARLRELVPGSRLLHGYLGDPLAGNHIGVLERSRTERAAGGPLADDWRLWSREELTALLRPDLADVFGAIRERRATELESMPSGPDYKREMFQDFWNRQRLLISYQPVMYDYWLGVETPFLAPAYAQFCLSLRREELVDRRLQKELLARRYPRLAAIPGTFASEPLVPTRRYALRRRLARRVPPPFLVGPLREFGATHRDLEAECLRDTGRAALWPLEEARDALAEWIDLEILGRTEAAALSGDVRSYVKLSGVQALAHWLLRP